MVGNEELKEYIGIVYAQEQSVYQQETLIQEIEQKVSGLGISQEQMPKKVSCFSMIGMLVLTLCGLCIFMYYISVYNSGMHNVALGVLISFIVVVVVVLATLDQVIKFYALKKKYLLELKQYEADYSRVLVEEKIKEKLSGQLPKMKRQYEESQRLLESMYNLGVIYPKYQGLIPISSFYDYLMSGSCYQLTGPDGAYNKYDIEARLDKIITQLDSIIRKLDQIKQNQFMLYRAIQNANVQNEKIMQSLMNMKETMNSIERNAELSAYYQRITSQEMKYRNYMDRKYHRWY